jgi:VIT1/CCC1 family predicted Fe2+/Mn2+ transporter
MKEALKVGITFGSTSGVITTLGLIVGLHSGTHSKLAMVGGILTIAIADAFSDALGIHISQESTNTKSEKHIWVATVATFLSKFLFAMTFLFPVLYFDFLAAIVFSVAWGLLVLTALSYQIARNQKQKPHRVILEHIVIALTVVVITHFVGDWVSRVFS